MAKGKKGRDVSGWLVIDKPRGMGSTDVVNKVRWLFNAKKAGHGGTLDPMATGVLPIALGEATKTMAYALDANKAYELEIQWGVETDSLDADGEVTTSGLTIPSAEQITGKIPEFIGEISQVPPKVSALKVDGRRAYDLAREGKKFELEARDTQVFVLEMLDHDPDLSRTRMRVEAVKGFYVRSLARDLAAALGTVAHLTALRRVRSGPFVADEGLSLEKVEEIGHMEDRDALLMPVDRVLADIPALDLGMDAARQLRNGQSVSVLRRSLLDRIFAVHQDGLKNETPVLVKADGKLVGIGSFEAGRIKPARLFNL